MYPSVQAQNNWWGRNSLSYVAGRVWERRDDDNLIQVQYEPFLTDNSSVLEGTTRFFHSSVLIIANPGSCLSDFKFGCSGAGSILRLTLYPHFD